MKTITILLLSISLAFSGVAQQQQGRGNDDTNPYRIFGSVEDSESNSPVQYATISLYTSADSVLVTGMITNPLGRFDLKTNPGNYYLKIDFIGYESRIVSGVTLNPDQKVFGSASDVLDNIPSVAVDIDGNITLRGSGEVR